MCIKTNAGKSIFMDMREILKPVWDLPLAVCASDGIILDMGPRGTGWNFITKTAKYEI